MPTAHEYFETDNAHVISLVKDVTAISSGAAHNIQARLLLDFDARARFLSVYLPLTTPIAEVVEALVCQLPTFLDMKCSSVRLPAAKVGMGFRIQNGGNGYGARVIYQGYGEDEVDADDLPFTGQIFVYSDRNAADCKLVDAVGLAKGSNLRLRLRLKEYAVYRTELMAPKAFVCHDSRDKEVAGQIARGLIQLRCPVWYDEFSLNVGDSLRERIESGLKAARWCIVLLTPNFLAKGGWPKREFTSAFTREIVEDRNVILPVWHGVDRDAVYQYAPILADRVALHWKDGEAEVCRKLFHRVDRDD